MPNGGPNKGVTYLVDYFDYNLFGIKLVNALNTSKYQITHNGSFIPDQDSTRHGSFISEWRKYFISTTTVLV
jgi:hypothetical protein